MTIGKNTFEGDKITTALLLLLILLATAASYSQVINFGFISLDDSEYVIDNQHIKTGFTLDSMRWAFTTRTDGNWFPLTWLSYMLDIVIAGSSPRTIHISNLLYHLTNITLLFAVLYQMTRRVYLCALVTALFALHPLHVEPVVWISERKELLCMLFFLLTIFSYSNYLERRSLFRYVLTVAFFALGLMSKSMLVSAPLLLLLMDYWPLKRFTSITSREFGMVALEKIPFLILSLASSIVTYNVQKYSGVVSFTESPLSTNLKNAVISYVMYIYKTCVPLNLSVIYPFQDEIKTSKAIFAALIIATVSFLVVRWRKEKPYLMVGWFWYLIALLPVIGIIRIGKQSMADRYTYLPHIGIFILLVWGVSEYAPIVKLHNNIKIFITTIIVGLLSVLTWNQVSYWKSSISLFSRAVEVTENNWVALGILGYDYIMWGERDKGLVLLNKSLDIYPKNVMALYNMGMLQGESGNHDIAGAYFKKVLALEPNYRNAHYQLGLELLYSGDTVGALKEHKILQALSPELAQYLMDKIMQRRQNFQ